MPLYIPSPPVNGFHVGPAFIHFYGLMYVIGIALAIVITQRRWKAQGGDPSLIGDVAIWGVPAGIIGGRIYFDLTTPKYIPHHWYGIFAVWDGGLGIWGGIALGGLVGLWRVRKHGASAARFADAVAPALLVAQAIGRIGNYFNQELFGGPTTLPWAVEISRAVRLHSGIPPRYVTYTTFQPSFLYELIFDLLLAAFLVWLGHHRTIHAPGLFALYVTGYSAYRIFEESIRIDYSQHFLGLRLNMFVAAGLALAGALWFWWIQARGRRAVAARADTGTSPAATQPEDTAGVPAGAGPEAQAGDAQAGDAQAGTAHAGDGTPGGQSASGATGTPATDGHG